MTRRITLELDDARPDSEAELVVYALNVAITAIRARPIAASNAVGEVRRRGQAATLEAVRDRIFAELEANVAEAILEADRQAKAEKDAAALERRRAKTRARIRAEILDSR